MGTVSRRQCNGCGRVGVEDDFISFIDDGDGLTIGFPSKDKVLDNIKL